MAESTEHSGDEVIGKEKPGKRARKKQAKSKSPRKPRNRRGPDDVVLISSTAMYPRYVSLEERQNAVERSKRAVYAYLSKMTNAHINLAARGNCQSAKFLFEFAGIENLPALAAFERTKAALSGACDVKRDDDPMRSVRSFSEKLGIPYPKLKPPKPVESASDPSEEFPSAV
jgi:hypothetical protein